MNRSTRDYLIHLLKKPGEKRKDSELEALLPVLKWRIECLRKLDKGIIMALLRLAYYKKIKKDRVITRQGKQDDRFYIIIQGSVSVFSSDAIASPISPDPVTTGEGRSCLSISLTLPSISDTNSMTKKVVRFQQFVETDPIDTSHFGRRIETLASLQAFGKMALLSSCTKSYTIVTNEDTELMVIPRQQFMESVKGYEEREVEQRKLFVRTHSYFHKWPEAVQEQLLNALSRDYHPLGSTIVKQGSQVTGLHFLISGRARLSAVPAMHRKQYPDLYINNDDFRETPPSDRHVRHIHLPTSHKEMISMTKHTHVKRSDGYAAAEKLVFTRNIEMCFVQEGEVLSDVELLLGLTTNLFTVTASLPCEVYSLSVRSYEKLFVKKNPQTVNLMKMLAETKLMGRKATTPGKKMDILPYLLNRMKFVRAPKAENLEDTVLDHKDEDDQDQGAHTTPLVSKPLHPADHTSVPGQNNFVLNWYKRNKAPLLKPVTDGAVYYKEIMQRRAKMRDELRQKYPKETAMCKAMSRRMRDAIWEGVKESMRTEKMLRSVNLRWSKDSGVKRWK